MKKKKEVFGNLYTADLKNTIENSPLDVIVMHRMHTTTNQWRLVLSSIQSSEQ